MVQEWYVVPGCHTKVWFTGEITKVTLPRPPHFVVDSAGFFHTPISVKRFPPRWALRPEVRGGGGGGSLLLLFLSRCWVRW